MTRDEYKTLHRLCRLAWALRPKEKGNGRTAARKSCHALYGLMCGQLGTKSAAMVLDATYPNRGYKWTNWRRENRFRELKADCDFRRVPF